MTSRKETTCEVKGQGPNDATVWATVLTKVHMLKLGLQSRHYCEVVEPLRGGTYLEAFQPKRVVFKMNTGTLAFSFSLVSDCRQGAI